MLVKLNEIKVGNRIRKDPGNIESLKSSMKRVGVIQPIVLDRSNNLIAGFRRLQAARALGWDAIEARIVDVPNRKTHVTMEVEENTTRRDFSPQELDTANRILERYNREGVFWNVINWILR